jgi:hypothetical protein
MLESVPWQTVNQAVEILGNCERVDDAIRQRIRALVTDDMTEHRLIDMIPEAFGLVILYHMPEAATAKPPTSFLVQDAAGQWRPIPNKDDPIFVWAIKIAMHIFHNGPRHIFMTNANRSSIIDSVNKMLNKAGPDALKDCTFELSFLWPPGAYLELLNQ